MPNELPIEYLTYDDIRPKAEHFLSRYHPAGTIPVPIEEIVELQLKINIVPLPGMRNSYDVDAFISRDMEDIYIDDQCNQSRYRFSIAHEIAHAVMHQKVFSKLEFHDLVSWHRVYAQIPEDEYGWLEFQAHSFAGLVLVPSNALRERFDARIEVASQKGVSFKYVSNAVRDEITKYIAEEFSVSSTTMAIRMAKEKLWTRFD